MKLAAPTILSAILACGTANPIRRADSPPYFITIGDSTVATSGGWGDGFLSFVASPADGTNQGKSGSTTESWRANGRWETLVETINETVDDYQTIVTMQFGHNDQKALSLDEYSENLIGLCTDIQDLGATPVCTFSCQFWNRILMKPDRHYTPQSPQLRR